MRALAVAAATASVVATTLPALAQETDFGLTYHVERIPQEKLNIKACGDIIVEAARQAGLSSEVQSFPGQLVTIRGGAEGLGAFIVQCIAVENTTVSVVQGIDYRGPKASLGYFADKAHAALKAVAN